MLILSLNNRSDKLAKFVASFPHNYKNTHKFDKISDFDIKSSEYNFIWGIVYA